jgi:hypothetical protein
VLGAYGLRLEGLEDARDLLVPALPGWPRIVIDRRRGPGESAAEHVSETDAVVRLRGSGGEIRIRREEGSATFELPREVRADELVHPLLAPVGAVMAHWLGRQSFHAGGVVVGDRAWGVIGERGAGKSTTAAALALRGYGLVCDDMLVLEDGRALAGPRSIDLRREAAEQLGAGKPLGVVGARERWRLTAGSVGELRPLAGWIFLGWGERVESVPVPAAERLFLLNAHRGLTLPARDPSVLLELAALPAWKLRRPQAWESTADAVDLLLETVS